MRLQVSWMPERNGRAPGEDLADVDVAQLAVEAAEPPLGLGREAGPLGDRLERFAGSGRRRTGWRGGNAASSTR